MPERDDPRLVRRHLIAGWSFLFVFVALGAALEAMHGLKVGFYVDLGNATRRLMWTLAHAHGVLLGLVNIAFAVTLSIRGMKPETARVASASLIGASILLPLGFFLGGIIVYGGDPSLGILLTPVGAALLLVAIVAVLRAITSNEAAPQEKPRQEKRR
jgi:hypothetical protein